MVSALLGYDALELFDVVLQLEDSPGGDERLTGLRGRQLAVSNHKGRRLDL